MQKPTELVREVLATQRLAVLATNGADRPHTSLVAFVATPDLQTIVFATTRATRKYRNICHDSRVAVFVDNARNSETDFRDAVALTAVGSAEEVGSPEREALLRSYLHRHPALADFVASPTCALMRVKVEKYDVVYRFQNVMELRIR